MEVRDKCGLCPECVWFVPEHIGVHWGAFGFIFCKTMCITSLCILLCMHLCAWVIIYVHVVHLHSFWVTFHCIYMHSLACFTVPYNCILVSCIWSHFWFILHAFHSVVGALHCILQVCCIIMHFDACSIGRIMLHVRGELHYDTFNSILKSPHFTCASY